MKNFTSSHSPGIALGWAIYSAFGRRAWAICSASSLTDRNVCPPGFICLNHRVGGHAGLELFLPFGFVMSILMRYTNFTRSFSVCTFFGVNSALSAMNDT